MEQTNKLRIKLIENLRKQIEKYQNNDIIKDEDNDNDDNNDVISDEYDDDNDRDNINNWKQRYLTEKRTSEYLPAECEDLQNEIENLRLSPDIDDNKII